MTEVTPISARKADHIRINSDEDVRSGIKNGLERYRFIHRALPELDLEDIDTSVQLFNHRLSAPILISSMTGGTNQAQSINRVLAEAAQTKNIAMGVGSQRAAIENPDLTATFQVRKYAPDILLLANLGAIQLNYGYSIDQCKRAVEMIEADALILHLNAIQEAVQPEGDTRFGGLTNKIEQVCRSLRVPVVIKEVGWGFSKNDVRILSECGISAIDVAGAGGTSWSQVEMYRAATEKQAQLAASFIDWGIPTADAILNVRQIAPNLKIFASGGLRNGVDIAKCLALGCEVGGMASPFLKSALQSLEKTIELIEIFHREIQICFFGTGAQNLKAFQNERIEQV